MRFAACLLVAVACSGALPSGQGQSVAQDSTTPPAAKQPKAASGIRQIDESQLVVKEWNSPISFDLDASWLPTLPFGATAKLKDLPLFYCDDVTLDRMEVTKGLKVTPGFESTTREVKLTLKFHLRARRAESDKVVRLEFALLNGEQMIPLGYSDDMELADDDTEWWSLTKRQPKDTFDAQMVEGSNMRLRVTMIVNHGRRSP